MLKRESIATEVWRRMSGIAGLKSDRNPETPPTAEDMPCGLIFEMADKVTEPSRGRDYPRYKREFEIIIELFTSAETSEESSRAITTLVEDTRKVLFASPYNLGGLGDLEERSTSRIVTVDAANHIKGISIAFVVKYAEDVADLFTV